MSSSPLGSSRSRHTTPQSRSSSRFTPRNRRGSPLSATSNILSSPGSSSTGRSSTCNSRTRPDTGQGHFLKWYIPRHIAGSHGGTPISHKDTPDYHNESTSQTDNDLNTREISSPMHNDSKKMWLLKYSDDRIQSLPLPPSEKPKILEFPVQDNIANIFKTPTSYPLLYSRYGVPMVPILPYYPANIGWSHYDHIWKHSQTSMLDPPPQGLFTHVGVAPRRDFTVAPDWRRISQYQL